MNKKTIVCISVVVMFHFTTAMDTENSNVISLQELTSRVVVRDLVGKLQRSHPELINDKRFTIFDKNKALSIDGDGLDYNDVQKKMQIIENTIDQTTDNVSVRYLLHKQACSSAELLHVIDKAGRILAQHYYKQLNGYTIDEIVASGMDATKLFNTVSVSMRKAIQLFAQYNFVLHYSYDKDRFNFYRICHKNDSISATYSRYFEIRPHDNYLNHATTIKAIFFGQLPENKLMRSVYFRHALIKESLEKCRLNIVELRALADSCAVKQLIYDDSFYQKELAAACNSNRDILLFSEKTFNKDLSEKMKESVLVENCMHYLKDNFKYVFLLLLFQWSCCVV